MSSESREDSGTTLLGRDGAGRKRRHGGRDHQGRGNDGGDGNDIEAADMEDLMDDILSPQRSSRSSSQATNGDLLSSTPLPSSKNGWEDVRRSSARNRGEQGIPSSVLRGSTRDKGGERASEEGDEEEMGGVVVGRARRRRSSGVSGRRGSGTGNDNRRGSGGIIDR